MIKIQILILRFPQTGREEMQHYRMGWAEIATDIAGSISPLLISYVFHTGIYRKKAGMRL